MRLWGINIQPIIFAAVVLPVLVIGVIAFRSFDLRGLSPARDLTDTWSGSFHVSQKFPSWPKPYCEDSGTLTLVLNQNGNTLAGTWQENITKAVANRSPFEEAHGLPAGPTCVRRGLRPVSNINNGSVSSSSFQFTVGTVQVTGSFTSDLMRGGYEFRDGQTVFKDTFKLTRSR